MIPIIKAHLQRLIETMQLYAPQNLASQGKENLFGTKRDKKNWIINTKTVNKFQDDTITLHGLVCIPVVA
jgi:hypothetical protein